MDVWIYRARGVVVVERRCVCGVFDECVIVVLLCCFCCGVDVEV